MTVLAKAITLVEQAALPDAVLRTGIALLVGRTQRRLAHAKDRTAEFVAGLTSERIAHSTDLANRQHYELPPAFFTAILGPQRKYSCCLYNRADSDLAAAEQQALLETVAHADLRDGQRILELGCGWGSLSLFMAQRFPRAEITAVSNSQPQRAFIEARAQTAGYRNLRSITADMNDFQPEGPVDRIVSVEMFEHMTNWHALLRRLHRVLSPEGRLFLHVFTHRDHPYRFDTGDQADWIAQHFFTGGIMPSHRMIDRFDDLFEIDADWRWNGLHYQRTALDWLQNYDRNAAAIEPLLRNIYGRDWKIWRRRWRLFFLATAGLFGHGNGEVWGVSHYRLKPVGVA
jgi:cyclopropane-fatty-acyl-phospholipid synthase